MKKKQVLKYCLALSLNIVPFFLCCLLYQFGIAATMLFPVFQVVVNLLNYKWTKKVLPFLFLNLAMIISTVSSIEIIFWLYYNNISSDVVTLAVGNLAVTVGIVFIALMTLISVICRIVSKRANKS